MAPSIPLIEQRNCPLCQKLVSVGMHLPAQDWEVRCERCGNYRTDCYSIIINSHQGQPLPGLSGIARSYHERGEMLVLTDENRTDYERMVPKYVIDKAERLLQAIANKTKYPGAEVTLTGIIDYPLAYASNHDELWYYAEYLKTRTFLAKAVIQGGKGVFVISPEGWAEVQAKVGANIDSDKAFVAMWFDPSMNPIYQEAIRPAIEADAGFRPVRVDSVEHTGKIDDRIIAEIRESRFLIADFTKQRGGVYFEAGFAMGLGLPVIWTCRHDEFGEVHFDTRQYNHIVWKEPGELREKLAVRIRATIGRGPGNTKLAP